MCYDATARPPVPPIAGGAGTAEGDRIVLTSADGARFSAFSAVAPKGRGGPGIVILPDVRGLHPFYQDLALRFADAGIHATAFDYFGRTAGLGERDDEFDWMAHTQQTRPDTIAMDVAATADRVRSPEGGAAASLFTVGFCFGGRNSFNQAARGHGRAGVIGFYGGVAPRDDADHEAPVNLVSRYECPVLGLFAGEDQRITRDHVDRFERALGDAGVANECVVYDGAPHSFFDRYQPDHREASDDAWRRMLAFIAHHS